MSSHRELNAHEAPPASIKEIFKRYQKIKLAELDSDKGIIIVSSPDPSEGLEVVDEISGSQLSSLFSEFCDERVTSEGQLVYHHTGLPAGLTVVLGLLILPCLVPLSAQKSLLSRLLHRDLSDERHKTNLHLHYDVKYPTKFNGVGETEPGSQIPELGPASSKQIEALAESEGHDSRSAQKASFFSYSPTSDMKFCPKDPSIHRPLSISKFFNKSLRWITLGGQYDWTKKVYPGDKPPAFPSDIQNLLNGLFPNMKAQAAIVNLYSPGDTLSLHRDVSEEVDKGLVSISIGCDCLFVIGLGKHPSDTLTIRLRSGDGVYMSKEARFAWHGVPRILPNTCPESLRSWPAGTGEYEEWRDWMSNKRINLNVRQMFED